MQLNFSYPAENQQGWRGWGLTPERREFSPDAALRLIDAARQASSKAYAPYSGFQVGAALVMADDPERRTFVGANVENASYGAAICAERTALVTAAAQGVRALLWLAVVAPAARAEPLAERMPCGICRQVIEEFASAQSTLIFIGGATPALGVDVFTLDAVLPHGFRFDAGTKSE